jgi:hypothetical protein
MEEKSYIRNRCNLCNKNYSSYQSLWIHNRKFHILPSTKTAHFTQFSTFLAQNVQSKKEIEIKNNRMCKHCNKIFTRSQSVKRHEDICKYKENKINEIEELKNKIKEIEEKNKELENKINNTNGNINNGNINNGTINNIQIVGLGRENLSKLTEKEQKNILKCVSGSLKKIIADINFNPKIPEQQNIKLTNLSKKTCKQYDEKSKNFIEVPKDRLLCSLINFRTGDLIEIYEEFKENGNKCHDSVNYIINIVNNYQDNSDNKEFEKKYINLKKEIELLIYNKTKELYNK